MERLGLRQSRDALFFITNLHRKGILIGQTQTTSLDNFLTFQLYPISYLSNHYAFNMHKIASMDKRTQSFSPSLLTCEVNNT